MVKKLSLLLSLSVCILGFAQKFNEKEFSSQVAKLEVAKSSDDFQKSKDFFAQSTSQNGTDWKTYYYTALAIVRGELNLQRQNKTQGIDDVSALAQKYLNAVFSKDANNTEANILQAQIYLLKSLKNDHETSSNIKLAEDFLKKAQKGNANNPRIDLVKGELILNSPSKNNGDKALAKKSFTSALSKFNTYKNAASLDPNWGKIDAEYYLSVTK
jgi:hypothetical protein